MVESCLHKKLMIVWQRSGQFFNNSSSKDRLQSLMITVAGFNEKNTSEKCNKKSMKMHQFFAATYCTENHLSSEDSDI